MSELKVNKISPRSGTEVAFNNNILFDTASKGIYLGVTTATASNLLNDYEEGTFTATLTAVTPPTSPPTTTGYYTKIGNVVYINIAFRVVSTLGASGNAKITGLPFTSTANNRTYGALWHLNTLVGSDNASTIGTSSSEIQFLVPNVGTFTDIVASTGRYVETSIFYFTDA